MANIGIQKEIHNTGDQGFGLTSQGLLVNRKRFIEPAAIRRVVRYSDDFLGDILRSEWAVVEGADTTTSDAAIVSGEGGTLVLTTGDSATLTYAGNGIQVTQGAFYNWKAANGGLRMEAHIKINDITTAAFFVGFTDLGTFEAPIESAASANTLTTNATDACGFMYDTRMSTDTIWLTGVKNNTDATAQNSGIAPVNNIYINLAVEIGADEVARFYINGALAGTPMTGALTKTVALTPTIAAASLVAATRTVTVDYIDLEMHRA
jgi:hypothetical protein